MRATVTFLGLVLTAQVARAQDDSESEAEVVEAMDMARDHMDDERARRHFEAGRSLYDAGAFDRAAREFEEAYQLSGRAELQYNIYVAYRDAGDARQAATALRRYLEEMESPPDRVNLEARLRALEEQVAALDAAEEASEPPQPEDTAAPPDVTASPEAASADEAGPSPLPWIVAGAGAAALVVATITGISALNAVGEIEDNCDGGTACPSDYDALEEDREDARTLVRVTDYLLLGGTVLLAAGLSWALFFSDEGRETAQVSAGCGADGCAATLKGSF